MTYRLVVCGVLVGGSLFWRGDGMELRVGIAEFPFAFRVVWGRF